jgi:hypothetical protein
VTLSARDPCDYHSGFGPANPGYGPPVYLARNICARRDRLEGIEPPSTASDRADGPFFVFEAAWVTTTGWTTTITAGSARTSAADSGDDAALLLSPDVVTGPRRVWIGACEEAGEAVARSGASMTSRSRNGAGPIDCRAGPTPEAPADDRLREEAGLPAGGVHGGRPRRPNRRGSVSTGGWPGRCRRSLRPSGVPFRTSRSSGLWTPLRFPGPPRRRSAPGHSYRTCGTERSCRSWVPQQGSRSQAGSQVVAIQSPVCASK